MLTLQGEGWQGAICSNCRGAGVIATDTAYNIVVNSGNIGFEAKMFGEGNAEKKQTPWRLRIPNDPKRSSTFLTGPEQCKEFNSQRACQFRAGKRWF